MRRDTCYAQDEHEGGVDSEDGPMRRDTQVEVFQSFEEENDAERQRRADMTSEERCEEFEVLQERHWGSQWLSEPMKRVASWEDVSW